MHRLGILFLAFVGPLFGQQPPYDVFPAAEPPYFRVRYEAATNDRGLVFAANFTVWIPPGVQSLRGV
ncbi:MAG TPA: hypothetical protein DCY13_16175, partial [Verrucomicrobiales bacterium]|nr:hypothetical protein [Verrucomicrobiales bacterium]